MKFILLFIMFILVTQSPPGYSEGLGYEDYIEYEFEDVNQGDGFWDDVIEAYRYQNSMLEYAMARQEELLSAGINGDELFDQLNEEGLTIYVISMGTLPGPPVFRLTGSMPLRKFAKLIRDKFGWRVETVKGGRHSTKLVDPSGKFKVPVPNHGGKTDIGKEFGNDIIKQIRNYYQPAS